MLKAESTHLNSSTSFPDLSVDQLSTAQPARCAKPGSSPRASGLHLTALCTPGSRFPQPLTAWLCRPWGRRDPTRRYSPVFLLFILRVPGFLKKGWASSPPSAWFPAFFPLFRRQRLLLLIRNTFLRLFIVAGIFAVRLLFGFQTGNPQEQRA